jgi:dTDP-4-dehydrorhamnose reductase
MVAAFKEGRALKAPEQEVRTPVDVITAGRALLELAVGDLYGVVHLAGNERLNRIEMGKRIAARFGFSTDLVVPQVAAGFPKRARRPRDVSLSNTKARSQLKTPMRNFDEGMLLVLNTAP